MFILFFFFSWKSLQILFRTMEINWWKKKRCVKYFFLLICWRNIHICFVSDYVSGCNKWLVKPCRYFRGKIFSITEKEGIFGCRDIRWFVNFNKWRRNGKNGKRKWKSGKEFYGSKIFYSSIKVSCARRRGKEKKVS